jgi:hypothetical protein
MVNIYGTRLFRKGETIFDPETYSYQKIEAVREMTIYGISRIFYRLDVGAEQSPEARWREHQDVLHTQPSPDDQIPSI